MTKNINDLIKQLNEDLPNNVFTIEDDDPMVLLGKLNQIIGYLKGIGEKLDDTDNTATNALKLAQEALNQVVSDLGTKVYDNNGNLKSNVKFEGHNGINVDIAEDNETFDIRLDEDITKAIEDNHTASQILGERVTNVESGVARALKTPISTPSELKLVGINTSNDQEMLNLGDGLETENGDIKVSDSVEKIKNRISTIQDTYTITTEERLNKYPSLEVVNKYARGKDNFVAEAFTSVDNVLTWIKNSAPQGAFTKYINVNGDVWCYLILKASCSYATVVAFNYGDQTIRKITCNAGVWQDWVIIS